MVLRERAKIGFRDIRKVVRWGKTQVRMVDANDDGEGSDLVPYHGLALIDSAEVDDATATAIAEVSQSRYGLKVMLHDKKGALVDIGRHLGIFAPPGHAVGNDARSCSFQEVSSRALKRAPCAGV
ncbi:hypothetical protein PS710_00555 [Pseudomonas fluorescens]|uniref:Uncharacterized protein n=2 Tax=Pseudomonas fluorescens TaxID=294 RepID=A0A5E7A457_PSEFL|nr:hypothetical protein PS710_00555 [Pseudomonas fluorescens]